MYDFIVSLCTIIVAAVLPLWFCTKTRVGRDMSEGIVDGARFIWRLFDRRPTPLDRHQALQAQLRALRADLAWWNDRRPTGPADDESRYQMISYLQARINELTAQLPPLNWERELGEHECEYANRRSATRQPASEVTRELTEILAAHGELHCERKS